MSIWTHINGNIRVNGLDGLTKDVNIKEILGEIVNYESNKVETTLPCGSEGSLEYLIWNNPDKGSIIRNNISIFGDLRDYDNSDEIEKWFKEVCSKLWIRNAVLEVEIESAHHFILIHKEGKISKVNV